MAPKRDVEALYDNPHLSGTFDGLRATAHTDLSIDSIEVPFHRSLCEPDGISYLTIKLTVADASQDIDLTFGKRVERRNQVAFAEEPVGLGGVGWQIALFAVPPLDQHR